MKNILYILLGFSLLSATGYIKAEATARPTIITKSGPHPCDSMPGKYKAKNLNDLDSITRFARLNVLYPRMIYHCNGASCTQQQFERMCYYMRQELIHNRDPNLTMGEAADIIEKKNKGRKLTSRDVVDL